MSTATGCKSDVSSTTDAKALGAARTAGGGWPANLRLVEGDLCDAKERYLCHQCNCVTLKGAHLSGTVFQRFPYANIYKERMNGTTYRRDSPGEIVVRGSPNPQKGQRLVINMLAQYYPGRSKCATDTGKWRQQWFQSCLHHIAALPDLDSLAFPYNIGCGAAGGNWQAYEKMLIEFAERLPNVRIVLYKLPSTV